MDQPTSDSSMSIMSVDDIKSNVMSNVPAWVAVGLALFAVILSVVALILFSTVSSPPSLGYKIENVTATNKTPIKPVMNRLFRITSTSDASVKIIQLTQNFSVGVFSYYLNGNIKGDITVYAQTSSGLSDGLLLTPGKGALYTTGPNGYSVHILG